MGIALLICFMQLGCVRKVSSVSDIDYFVGGTMVLNTEAVIFDSGCPAISGDYMMVAVRDAAAKTPCLQGRRIIDELSVGQRFAVKDVVLQPGGSLGKCYRVIVEFLGGDQDGIVADIPACWFMHPRSWINWVFPGREDQFEALQIKPEFAVPYSH
jgi:hypothetical protein